MSAEEELKRFVMIAVKGLCDYPALVTVDCAEGEKSSNLFIKIKTHPDDMPLVIGKKGRNINAIKEILRAIAAKHHIFAYAIVND